MSLNNDFINQKATDFRNQTADVSATQGLGSGPAPRPNSIREELLLEARRLTAGDRDREYGDPMVNLNCATQLKRIFHAFQSKTGRTMTEAEREAIDMVLTKLSRIACGPTIKPDTYIDGASYFAIAGEASIRADQGQLPHTPVVSYPTDGL